MTSLIDVIFLLLLFFMLSSTFSKFSDVELQTTGGKSVSATQTFPVFVRISSDNISLNGQTVEQKDLISQINTRREQQRANAIILAVSDTVSAQKFVDVLTTLQTLSGMRLQIVN